MKHMLVSGLVVCLALTACGGGPATPDPAEVARLVDQAVKATIAAMPTPELETVEVEKIVKETVIFEKPVEVTVVVEIEVVATPTLQPTATPAPTSTPVPPTATPAPTSTPVPPVNVPSDWVEYAEITGMFTVHHPDTWEVDSDDVGTVAFRLPGIGGAGVSLVPEWRLPAGKDDEDTTNQLVGQVRDGISSLDTFRLVDKGVWRNKGYFVEYSLKDFVYDRISQNLWVFVPVGTKGVKMMGYQEVGDEISDQVRDTLDLVLSSMIPSA